MVYKNPLRVSRSQERDLRQDGATCELSGCCKHGPAATHLSAAGNTLYLRKCCCQLTQPTPLNKQLPFTQLTPSQVASSPDQLK